ncbi:NUDIX hydrolase, conserved [Angomonas deanei]|uniref:NUDIX domain containing protein, putative n=1 Tax=Angomonas deanei TaxID=59799 RepID=A0A7G2CBX0_9TRYP|nr:NUDIX hydrolase, conserved [Angomonas deanei]CAD2216223.1 NUDIX domain containing protein, putative [Angomonas deanei]|eukprot:EPY28931.1 NUDIX hydrolase, conserved [Angomonas deanei]
MYRSNVCAIIFNEFKQFLGCQRIHSEYYQCVQGGIEKSDHDIVLAAKREIEEEIGIPPDEVQFVCELSPPNGDTTLFRYTLAANANLRRFGYIGQQQRMLLFFMPSDKIEKVVVVPPKELRVPQEFKGVKWVDMETLKTSCSPEKKHIFETLSVLCPPVAEEFLTKNGLLASSGGN